MADFKEDIDIVIESYEQYDYEGNKSCSSSYVHINGELIDSDGDHIKAVLRHLGYNVTVDYI